MQEPQDYSTPIVYPQNDYTEPTIPQQSRREKIQGRLRKLSKRQWALFAAVVAVVIVLIVLFFVFDSKIKTAIEPLALRMRDLPSDQGYVIMACLVLAASIPPMIGFSAFCYMSGFVFGFPLGVFPCVAGAFVGAILVFR